MSIIFHEGVPGSGKSYEAVVCHLIPALKKGRHVVTNIKGVNLEKISELINRPADYLAEICTFIPWLDSKDIVKNPVTDALYLIDEVQDFWPSGRDKLDAETTEFITQHRHYGLDIILMGQAVKDIHNLWRNRVDKKFYFVKKDAIGKPTNYQWTCHKRVGPEKFAFVNDGGGKYEAKYFGTYASHRPDTDNTDNYTDKRANIWSRPLFKYGIPAFVIVFCWAIYFLYSIFSGQRNLAGDGLVSSVQAAQGAPGLEPYSYPSPASAPSVSAYSEPVPSVASSPPVDQLGKLLKDYRPRLSAIVVSSLRTNGKIDFYDQSLHRQESLSFDQIALFGGRVEVREIDVTVYDKTGASVVVTAWPLVDLGGQIPQAVQRSPQITGDY